MGITLLLGYIVFAAGDIWSYQKAPSRGVGPQGWFGRLMIGSGFYYLHKSYREGHRD